MTNNGQWLERFVKGIESHYGGEGLKVETNLKAYGADGIQLAEFDVIISGRMGTVDFTALMECRDRPSEGAAPGSWIEQMAGRQRRFNFHKVIAVSTTGFSPSAFEAAANLGIEIREVSEIGVEAVSDWLGAIGFCLRTPVLDERNVVVSFTDGTPLKTRDAAADLLKLSQCAAAVLYEPAKKRHLRLIDLWHEHSKSQLGPASGWDISKPVEMNLDLASLGLDLRILTGKGLAFLQTVSFSMKVRMVTDPMQRTYSKYSKAADGSVICESVAFASTLAESDGLKLEMSWLPNRHS